jgi:xanthine/uracil permease
MSHLKQNSYLASLATKIHKFDQSSLNILFSAPQLSSFQLRFLLPITPFLSILATMAYTSAETVGHHTRMVAFCSIVYAKNRKVI